MPNEVKDRGLWEKYNNQQLRDVDKRDISDRFREIGKRIKNVGRAIDGGMDMGFSTDGTERNSRIDIGGDRNGGIDRNNRNKVDTGIKRNVSVRNILDDGNITNSDIKIKTVKKKIARNKC